MSKLKHRRELIPPWKMPSDPVKAVFWFFHWLLKVAARFFWVPISVMVILEYYLNMRYGGILNGLISGVITLIVGLIVWGALYAGLRFWDVGTAISDTVSELGRMQQGLSYRRPLNHLRESEPEGNVVEGSITDLEEERKKRRQDN